MKIEIEDVLFWMDAVRNSEDKYRTLESFWKGQVRSKVWLAETLEEYALPSKNKIVIHGGWNGVLASILFNSNINIDHITSVDIDPSCQEIASTINKRQEMEGRFTAVTADMVDYEYKADIVINTSFEHITEQQYKKWLKNVPPFARIVLQSNNYFECKEHVRCSENVEDFVRIANITPYHVDVLETPMYERYMMIGSNR